MIFVMLLFGIGLCLCGLIVAGPKLLPTHTTPLQTAEAEMKIRDRIRSLDGHVDTLRTLAGSGLECEKIVYSARLVEAKADVDAKQAELERHLECSR